MTYDLVWRTNGILYDVRMANGYGVRMTYYTRRMRESASAREIEI